MIFISQIEISFIFECFDLLSNFPLAETEVKFSNQVLSCLVIRQLEQNPELGPELLKTISSLKKGESNESVLPKLAVSTIKYAANVLG